MHDRPTSRKRSINRSSSCARSSRSSMGARFLPSAYAWGIPSNLMTMSAPCPWFAADLEAEVIVVSTLAAKPMFVPVACVVLTDMTEKWRKVKILKRSGCLALNQASCSRSSKLRRRTSSHTKITTFVKRITLTQMCLPRTAAFLLYAMNHLVQKE